ncbi:MAG: hypothetical protein JW862_12075, partial [Anaerolineales bacterium]|nr:hypothetical protein [Anaerolineales bacterium]
MQTSHHLTGSQRQRTTPVRYALMLVFMLVLLSSCVTLPDPESGQVQDGDVVLVLKPGHRAGQSFSPTRSGLNQVSFWVRAQQSVDLQVALYRYPGDAQPLFETQWTASDGQNTITPPTLESQGYYLELRAASAALELLGRAEDVYAGGQAFQDGNPLAADLAFSTGYAYDFQEVLVDLGAGLAHAWLLLPLSLVLLLPGWWLLEVSGLRSYFDFSSCLALALALSLSLVALLLAWSSWLNLRWTATTVWIAALLPALHLSWRQYHCWTRIQPPQPNITAEHAEYAESSDFPKTSLQSPRTLRLKIPPPRSINWSEVGFNTVLVLVFLAAWLVRAAMVRDLAAPAWVDPVHHGLIT